MIDRIVEIANPARLSIRDAQLVIERPKEEQLTLPFTTPVSEIAVLLLAHPQISLSQAVLSRIAEAGGSVVTIDGNFLPASMLLPRAEPFHPDRAVCEADGDDTPDPQAALAANRPCKDQGTGRVAKRTPLRRPRTHCDGCARSLRRSRQS